ncbi:adenylate/guanylate cyclase domain-containing protein [Ensifer sp. 4252]|uniref:adenylate/guanylate cyclase domain-containing protein n=1 Tax=Ensifer sp. 4252 TaxID=3373915 RepID=UPI003D1DA7AF
MMFTRRSKDPSASLNALKVSSDATLTTSRIDRLLADADTEAEFTIGWVRIAAGLSLFAGGLFVSSGIGSLSLDPFAERSAFAALLSVSAFVALSAMSLLLISRRLFRPWMSFLLVGGDTVILGLALIVSLEDHALRGNWIAAMPVAWAAPLVLTVSALRYRATVQLCFAAFLTVGFFAVAYGLGFEPFLEANDVGASSPTSDAVARLFSLPPYLMRGLLFVMLGLTTVLTMSRARRLLLRAVGETVHGANLARFLPLEIASLVGTGGIVALREGRRQQATIMFVDIRGFTALAEDMDPARLSIFVSSFRRRVMDAAVAHDAVVDKFIGDGALLVFGIPEPRTDDSARAIACAHHILASVQRWNSNRRFNPPVRVGIGLHSGVVYFGLLGDDRRLEFTVLGDVVNVAARIEQATKEFNVPLLASTAVVEEAGQRSDWREITHEPLRGRGHVLGLLAPR